MVIVKLIPLVHDEGLHSLEPDIRTESPRIFQSRTIHTSGNTVVLVCIVIEPFRDVAAEYERIVSFALAGLYGILDCLSRRDCSLEDKFHHAIVLSIDLGRDLLSGSVRNHDIVSSDFRMRRDDIPEIEFDCLVYTIRFRIVRDRNLYILLSAGNHKSSCHCGSCNRKYTFHNHY